MALISTECESKPTIILLLLAKDWRLFRTPTIALLVLTLGSYGLGLAGALYRSMEMGGPFDAFFSASMIALNLVPLVAAAFGGMAIAGERSERTADFMALLPVSRGQIILSKLLISFFTLTAFGAFNGLVAILLLWANTRLFWTHENFRQTAPESLAALALWAGCAICSYSLAWLCSTFSKSGPITACISIGVTVAIITLIAIGIDGHRQNNWFIPLTIATSVGTIGIAALVGGSTYYLRRVAP